MPDNPSFQSDPRRRLMRVHYQYKVGKIGLDSRAGWVATVEGQSGAVFVQRFVLEPKKEYPDGSSVEFRLNGAGKIHAYNRDIVMPTRRAEKWKCPCCLNLPMPGDVLSPYGLPSTLLFPSRHLPWFFSMSNMASPIAWPMRPNQIALPR